MIPRERIQAAWRREQVDRVPFVPAVYEHKASLIRRRPSEIARDGRLLLQALERELVVYRPDALTLGVDVYNVEAEALGCPVRFFDDSEDVPAVTGPPAAGADPDRLPLPRPDADGRMPLFLEAAARAVERWGDRIFVRGALTGPWSLACALAGTERLLLETMDDPPFVRRLLDFCADVAAGYGRGFLDRGAGVIVFDSKASPAASSPRVFRDFVAPVYRDRLLPALKAGGAKFVPVIVGGNTDAIAGDLLDAGATQVLCDAGSDLGLFERVCRAAGASFRFNIDARLVHRGDRRAIYDRTMEFIRSAGRRPGALLGCGVVAYDASPSSVLAIRAAIEDDLDERT